MNVKIVLKQSQNLCHAVSYLKIVFPLYKKDIYISLYLYIYNIYALMYVDLLEAGMWGEKICPLSIYFLGLGC